MSLFDKWAKTHRTLWAVYKDRQVMIGHGLEIVDGQSPQFLDGVANPLPVLELWGPFLENGLGLLDQPLSRFEVHFETEDVRGNVYDVDRLDRRFCCCKFAVESGTLFGRAYLEDVTEEKGDRGDKEPSGPGAV